MNETVRRTKILTEASVAAAIATMFVLLKLLAPFLVFVTMVASPIPIALIAAFHGMRWGVGTSVAVVVLVTIFGGPEIGLTTAFYAWALGLALGYGTRKGLSYKKTLFLTAAAYLIEMTYKIIFSIYVLGLTDTLSSVVDKFITFIRWIWVPLAGVLHFDPDPSKVMLTASGSAMVGLVFIINAFCYAYLSLELFEELYRRMKTVRR
jgi:uncharacterized protein YybS (DUF2232 family)